VKQYQEYTKQLVTKSIFGSPGLSLQLPEVIDARLLRVDGLQKVGEVSAVDLFRFRSKRNHIVIPSTVFPSTFYVLFNTPPSVSSIVRQYLGIQPEANDELLEATTTRAAMPKAKPKARVRQSPKIKLQTSRLGRMSLQPLRRKKVLPPSVVLKAISEAWAVAHPASRAVDPTGASTYVQIMERRGDALVAQLRDLDILPRSASQTVKMSALHRHLTSYTMVTIGARASFSPTAPTSQCGLCCTCGRFSLRGRCGHSTFCESLTFEGVRHATVTDLQHRVLVPARDSTISAD
jgi:hypothetical protein